MKILRGKIYSADLNPRFGTEAGKVRPVLVLQTNDMNGLHPSALVCPITSKVTSRAEILRVHLRKGEGGLSKESDVMVDQLRAIDNRRFKKEVGRISALRLREIEERILILLDIS